MSRTRALDALATLALVVLALALRLPHGDLAEWKGDEAVQFERARALAREGVAPRRGLPTTDGPRMTTHNLYLLAAPLLFRDGPEAIRLGMAVLATASLAALYLVGKSSLGRRAALAAALLLATAPDSVRRGRWSWNPNLVWPLALATLLALLATARAPRGRAAAWLLVLATLLGLTHYSPIGAAGLGFVVALGAAARARGRLGGSVWPLLLGGAGVAALVLPPILGELGSGFAETRDLLAVAAKGRARPEARSEPERRALAFPALALEAFDLESYARALGPEESGPEAAATHGLLPRPLTRTGSLVSVGLLLAGVGLGALELAQAARRLLRREAVVLGPAGVALTFGLAAWAPFLVLKLPARPHYPGAAVGALACSGALALVRVSGTRARRLAASLLLLGLGVGGVLATSAVLAAVAAGASRPGTSYDLPIGEKARACELVLEGELVLAPDSPLEYLELLSVAHRALEQRDPERARRFERRTLPIPYWETSVAVPVPRESRGRVRIVFDPERRAEHVLGRSGPLALVPLGP